MTKDEFDKLLPIAVPVDVAVCPICGATIVIDSLDEWIEDRGCPANIEIDEDVGPSFNCTTEPDIDSYEWSEWMQGHWNMPYADWLPLERPITRWLNKAVLKVTVQE